MPRYFFDISDGGHTHDEDGSELPDLQAARMEAFNIATELFKGRGEAFWRGHAWEVACRGACGLGLFTLTFMANDGPAVRGPAQAA